MGVVGGLGGVGDGAGSGTVGLGFCSQSKYSETVMFESSLSLFFKKAICGEVILACTNSTLMALFVSLFVGVPKSDMVLSLMSILP